MMDKGSLGRQAGRTLLALLLVAAVSAIDARLKVNSSTAALSYLLVVLALAARGGLQEAVAASLVGMLCFNLFFLPPIGTLTIADPQNWAALVVFLITAITASKLSASAKKRADEASARRREMERLYQFSRALMLGDEGALPRQIAQQVANLFEARETAFYDAESNKVSRAGDDGSALPDDTLRRVAQSRRASSDEEQQVFVVPVQLGGRNFGSLGCSRADLSDSGISALAQLAAIAVERARQQQITARVEAARESEHLKATLLDALAHEFKTPLTSIKAAVSSVLSVHEHERTEHELLTVVDEETDRLTDLVTETIKVARIEAGQVQLHRVRCSVHALVLASLTKLRTERYKRDIQVDVPDNLPELDIDIELGDLALRQLVGNALKYAPPSSAIRIKAAEEETDFISIHVENDGPGIPASEQQAIFEKFYRAKDVRGRVPGSGMGLTIAREIVRAHGGRAWVDSTSETVRFSITLPVSHHDLDQAPEAG
jgi:two-component system sensor histidine kinase KdpD